jgi:hypothetical protein
MRNQKPGPHRPEASGEAGAAYLADFEVDRRAVCRANMSDLTRATTAALYCIRAGGGEGR